MKVGDYVRTNEFGIQKVKWFDNEEPILGNGFTALQKEYKSSPNIIDLIEVGDIIKGIGNMIFSVIDIDYENKIISGIDFWCEEKDIKSIVTREMFESIEYKVKE